MLNRVEFVRLANTSLSLATLSTSRASLCELLAIRLFRAWSERTVELAHVLLTPWDLYKGCGEDVRKKLEEEGEDEVQSVGNALEVSTHMLYISRILLTLTISATIPSQMAIRSKSKRFIKSPSCQKVIEGVWSGRVVYQAASNSHAIISDVSQVFTRDRLGPHSLKLIQLILITPELQTQADLDLQPPPRPSAGPLPTQGSSHPSHARVLQLSRALCPLRDRA